MALFEGCRLLEAVETDPWRLVEAVEVCRGLWKFVEVRGGSTEVVEGCGGLWRFVEVYGVEGCGGLCRFVEGCTVQGCGGLCRFVEVAEWRVVRVVRVVEGCGGLWRVVEVYGGWWTVPRRPPGHRAIQLMSSAVRLHSISPNVPPTCSVRGAREDVHHRVEACPWLVMPVRVLDCNFPVVQSASGRAPTSPLCSDYPKLSLTRAPGLLLWKTIRVLWQYRCDVRFCGTVPDVSAFLRMLHSEGAKWLEMPELSLAHQAVHLYMEGLHGWLSDRSIPVKDSSVVAMQKRTPPPEGGGVNNSLS